MRAIVAAVLASLCGSMASGQPAGKSVFEAASIRPSDPSKPESFWRVSPGRVTVQNMTLKSLVMAFYKRKRYQVTGGPKWIDTDRFDIVAKLADGPDGAAARGANGAARLLAAAQALLADRFQLAFHEESRTLPGYALVAAKSGFKLKPASGDGSSTVETHRGTLRAVALSMVRLASTLSTELDDPVMDATGIEGAYDFTLEWEPVESAGAAPQSDRPLRPSLFTALQETLGLKLEARKVPLPVMVIDRAEKAGGN